MWKFTFLFFCISQCLCLYRESETILKVTADNYEDNVESQSKPIILHAYSPLSQQCKDVARQFIVIAEELKDLMKFACLQIEKEKDLARELGIKKPNSFYLVRHGQLHQFSGPISSKQIVSLAMNQVLENLDAVEESGFQYFFKNVLQLTDENFERNIMKNDKPWMILFYSPKISESKHMIPIWYDAALHLKDEINFGSVDCATNIALAKEYDVAGYPTGILLIHYATYYLHYNAHLNADFIVEWIRNKVSEYNDDELVNELTSNYRYEKCIEKPLCILVFVPHILDCAAECRHDLLKILMAVYEKYNDYKWGWLWCEVGSQGDLERSLEINNYVAPTAIAINSKKNKFTSLRGSYCATGLDHFLQDILLMKVPSSEMKKYVHIHETETWDGKDGERRRNNLDFFDVDVKVKEEL